MCGIRKTVQQKSRKVREAMSVLIKGMEMPKSCDDCNFESLMCCFLMEKRLAIETFKKGLSYKVDSCDGAVAGRKRKLPYC